MIQYGNPNTYIEASSDINSVIIFSSLYTRKDTYTSVIKNNNNVIVMNIKDMPYANCFYSKDNKQWNKIPFLLPHRPLKERINKTNVEPKQDNYNPNNPNTNIVSAHVRIIGKYIFFVLNVPVCAFVRTFISVTYLVSRYKRNLNFHFMIESFLVRKRYLSTSKTQKYYQKRNTAFLCTKRERRSWTLGDNRHTWQAILYTSIQV